MGKGLTAEEARKLTDNSINEIIENIQADIIDACNGGYFSVTSKVFGSSDRMHKLYNYFTSLGYTVRELPGELKINWE